MFLVQKFLTNFESNYKIKNSILETELLSCSIGIGPNKLIAKIGNSIEVDFERRNNKLLMNLVFPQKLIAITTSARNNPASFVLRMGLLVTPACPDIGTLTLEAQYVATKLHFLHNLGLAEKSTIPSIAIEALRLLFVQGRVIPEGERERFTRDAITALRLSEGMPEFAGLLADRKGEFYTLKSARNAMTLLTNL